MTYTDEEIQEHCRQWLAALRSGEYRQTKGKLKARNHSFCCLGVACEVAGIPSIYYGQEYYYGPEGALKAVKDDEDGEGSDWLRVNSTSLPPVAQEWLGTATEAPRLAKPVTFTWHGEEVKESSLIELNDTYGWSFEQIAEAVEKNGLA